MLLAHRCRHEQGSDSKFGLGMRGDKYLGGGATGYSAEQYHKERERDATSRAVRRGLRPGSHEAAANHCMTSSARSSSDGGMVRPSALAVLRLITSSYLVGCSIGRSPGLAPLIMRSTYPAACRAISLWLGV